jgi:hypothetical protein
MRQAVWLLLILLPLLATASACGGDDSSPSDSVTITPDLEERRAGMSEEETLELFGAIMTRRVEFIEGSADATINADQTLTVEYSDLAGDVAVDLFSNKADLRLLGPRRAGPDTIVCLTAEGGEVHVPITSIVYDPAGTGFTPLCELEGGSRAEIAWEEQEAGQLGAIENLEITHVALLTETGPTLIVTFNSEGSLKLSGITAGLIGLPLGIFIDDQLMASPQVSASIENGQLPIAGLSLRNARILRAQLRAGSVPAPFTATFE